MPGVTAEVDGAEVRAFVPWPVDATPKEIGRLQLQGFELEDAAPVTIAEPEPGGAVIVSLEPSLSTGKAAAAAAHAGQLTMSTMSGDRLEAWVAATFPVTVERPSAERFAMLIATAPVVVRDGGFTEVAPGTVTAIARWS
jgi:peptidyl-tRNA hydrolase